MSEKIKKEIFLDNLPHREGLGNNKGKQIIDWLGSKGYKVNGVYDNTEFEVEIIDYKDGYLYIKYLDEDIFKIATQSFINCMIGRLLGKRTNKFKIKIDQVFKDDNRDITIIGVEYRISNNGQKCKWYNYKCNKCNNEDWIIESDILNKKHGCNACGNGYIKPKLGINTIWDKARWMCDLGVSKEDAKTHTCSSNDKIIVTCPDCGKVKDTTMMIRNIYKRRSIGCSCSDGKSYPEKYLISVLKQLDINFTTEYSPKWCEFPFREGIRKGRYDFYFMLNGKEYFIETDGDWHGTFNNYSKITAQESLYIDRMKDELAYKNNVNMIRIDCKKSISDYIKQNVILGLNSLFDLSQIDWLECERFALGNLVKIACDYKKNNPNMTALEISRTMNISRSSISKFLKVGTKLKWCNYTPKEDSKNYTLNAIKSTSKKIEVFKDGNSVGEFNSLAELRRESKGKFNKFLNPKYIVEVCNGEREEYKGFTFKYITESQSA